jgi:hypothetical protein
MGDLMGKLLKFPMHRHPRRHQGGWVHYSVVSKPRVQHPACMGWKQHAEVVIADLNFRGCLQIVYQNVPRKRSRKVSVILGNLSSGVKTFNFTLYFSVFRPRMGRIWDL